MAELRWILLGLGLLLIVGIWWRGTRRSGQAQGDFALRDLASSQAATYPPEPTSTSTSISIAAGPPSAAPSAAREWPQTPLDPLRIRTAEFDQVPVLDTPMIIEPALPATPPPAARRPPVAAQPPAPSPPSASIAASTTPARRRFEARTDHSDRFAPLAQSNPNASERQKIISLRICALAAERWPGTKLLEALELQGLAYGRYQVFHRNHADGRSLFCVASLVEPGTFDKERMPTQDFHGITAFAVLPGPLEPVQTVEALIATARRLAESLTGMVQDGKGLPLSPQRASALREEAARFQAELG